MSDESVLRDPAEASLNEVLAGTRRAAALYVRLTEEAEPTLAALFGELAAAHRARARELEAAVRALGALPMGPDPDAETLEGALARLRASLAGLRGDADRARAAERLRAAEELTRALDEAASHALPASADAALRRLRATLDDARARLARYAAERDAGDGP